MLPLILNATAAPSVLAPINTLSGCFLGRLHHLHIPPSPRLPQANNRQAILDCSVIDYYCDYLVHLSESVRRRLVAGTGGESLLPPYTCVAILAWESYRILLP